MQLRGWYGCHDGRGGTGSEVDGRRRRRETPSIPRCPPNNSLHKESFVNATEPDTKMGLSGEMKPETTAMFANKTKPLQSFESP